MIHNSRELTKSSIGIDIGGTKILSAYAYGEQLYDVKLQKTPNSLEEILSYITNIVEKRRLKTECFGVGIGIAGAWQEDGSLWVPNIPALTGVCLDKLISERVGLPVFIENDAHSALRGELWQGSLRGCKNAVMISIGTGIGSGIILDGHILQGVHGAAGAIGWLCIKEPEDGKFRYEELASGTSLGKMALDCGYNTSRNLIQAVKEGRADAISVFDKWVSYLGRGIASVVSMLDIETVVIAGGLSSEFDLYEEKLCQVVKTLASPNEKKIQIKKSLLAEEACLYGAAALGQQISF